MAILGIPHFESFFFLQFQDRQWSEFPYRITLKIPTQLMSKFKWAVAAKALFFEWVRGLYYPIYINILWYFPKNTATPQSSIFWWDFPWTKPSSYWGAMATPWTPRDPPGQVGRRNSDYWGALDISPRCALKHGGDNTRDGWFSIEIWKIPGRWII